ncbi:universal stress protein [Pleionea sediminis]|uniref:universal stress protein n=1 Tax=Pleionea sediminis TaxID=2569479 RepID=UPI0013DDAF37|nr:universal stress protein [Pleionea sediminis]
MTSLRILVDINPEQKDTLLLEKLQKLATTTTLDVTLFICDYQPAIASNLILHPESLEQAVKQIKKQHQSHLEQLIEKFNHKNINYSTQVEWHKPYYESVMKAAKSMNADLVFKQATHHNRLKKIFITPGDFQLLKSCEQPLLLSKDNRWDNAECVMAAVDPSHHHSQDSHLDDIIIQQAKELAEALSLPLKVCHVFDPAGWEVVMNSTASTGVMGQFIVLDTPEDHQALMKRIRNEHLAQLKILKERHQLSDDETVLLEGFPEEALEQAAAQNKAALLVVGTTYRSGLLGSTAERLLDDVSCDIVAVKPGDFDALQTH